MKAVSLLVLLACTALALGAPPETKAEKDARMKWWKDSRFGLFLHWGSYSVAEGEWNGKTNYAEWIREEAHIELPDYEQLAKKFNPVDFDADKWVLMAKNAGMKYIVITTKHHEGFNMFASKYSDYNIMNTPFHRDVMKELAAACKRHGMKMCFYHSIMDWHHPDYLPRRSWEHRSAEGADFDRFNQYLQNEVAQLLTDYGPIGLMWFDGEWESTWNHKYGQALYDLCRKVQPNVIVNNRVDVGRSGTAGMSTTEGTAGDYGTPEQEIPAQGLPNSYWETCMTMNDHWGYNKTDHDYKSSTDLIQKLVDIASKGGNFLLNIGPTPEGDFPPEAQERLAAMGNWMHTNSEAIYDTDASPFPKLSWGRCTTGHSGNNSNLYLDVFDWPTDGKLVVPGIGNQPVRAFLLADRHKSLKIARHEGDLVIDVPQTAPDGSCSVVELQVAGKPIVYSTPTIKAATDLVVQPVQATLDAGSPSLEIRYTLDGSDPNGSSQLYTGPVTISDTTTLKARTFDHGKGVSSVATEQFTKASLLPAAASGGSAGGLKLEVFSGNWEKLPDFDSLTPEETGSLDHINVDKWPKREHFGIRLTGFLNVPQDGVYRFALASDDGSRLKIDGHTVIDNDGSHSMSGMDGSLALAKGPHAVTLEYFNGTGDLGLDLEWALAGQKVGPVDATAMSH